MDFEDELRDMEDGDGDVDSDPRRAEGTSVFVTGTGKASEAGLREESSTGDGSMTGADKIGRRPGSRNPNGGTSGHHGDDGATEDADGEDGTTSRRRASAGGSDNADPKPGRLSASAVGTAGGDADDWPEVAGNRAGRDAREGFRDKPEQRDSPGYRGNRGGQAGEGWDVEAGDGDLDARAGGGDGGGDSKRRSSRNHARGRDGSGKRGSVERNSFGRSHQGEGENGAGGGRGWDRDRGGGRRRSDTHDASRYGERGKKAESPEIFRGPDEDGGRDGNGTYQRGDSNRGFNDRWPRGRDIGEGFSPRRLGSRRDAREAADGGRDRWQVAMMEQQQQQQQQQGEAIVKTRELEMKVIPGRPGRSLGEKALTC